MEYQKNNDLFLGSSETYFLTFFSICLQDVIDFWINSCLWDSNLNYLMNIKILTTNYCWMFISTIYTDNRIFSNEKMRCNIISESTFSQSKYCSSIYYWKKIKQSTSLIYNFILIYFIYYRFCWFIKHANDCFLFLIKYVLDLG